MMFRHMVTGRFVCKKYYKPFTDFEWTEWSGNVRELNEH